MDPRSRQAVQVEEGGWKYLSLEEVFHKNDFEIADFDAVVV